MRNFKVKYQKQLMNFVVSRINEDKSASDIIKEVDVLQAIRWTGQACGDDVLKNVMSFKLKVMFQGETQIKG